MPMTCQNSATSVTAGTLVAASCLAATVILSTPSQSGAHEWYPARCCSDRDCAPIDDSEVQLTSSGWRILQTGETISFDDAEASPDGRFHRCMIGGDPERNTICLFVPGMGS